VLKEFRNVLQRPGEHQRRWFQSADEELIVWYEQDGSIHGFQLCYDRVREERALTWINGKGYSHLKVDDGEIEPLIAKRTPILVTNGLFDSEAVLERFNSVAAALPLEIRALVSEKIRQYSRA